MKQDDWIPIERFKAKEFKSYIVFCPNDKSLTELVIQAYWMPKFDKWLTPYAKDAWQEVHPTHYQDMPKPPSEVN